MTLELDSWRLRRLPAIKFSSTAMNFIRFGLLINDSCLLPTDMSISYEWSWTERNSTCLHFSLYALHPQELRLYLSVIERHTVDKCKIFVMTGSSEGFSHLRMSNYSDFCLHRANMSEKVFLEFSETFVEMIICLIVFIFCYLGNAILEGSRWVMEAFAEC